MKVVIVLVAFIICVWIAYKQEGNRNKAICGVISTIVLGMITNYCFNGFEYVLNFRVLPHIHSVAETKEENVVEASCIDEGSYELVEYCKCGKELNRNTVHTDVLGHDYQNTDSEFFCTEQGQAVYTCSRCGDSYVEEYKALGHDYRSVVTEPTCVKQGFTTYTCSRCENSYTDNYVEAIGHNFSHSKCTRCGEKEVKKQLATSRVDFLTFKGEIVEENQEDSFSFTAPESGVYTFSLEDTFNGFSVNMRIEDGEGNTVVESQRAMEKDSYISEETFLEGSEYKVFIEGNDSMGQYTVKVGQQKRNVNISKVDIVKEAIEYKKQRIMYSFTPEFDGIYRFELSRMKNDFRVDILIRDELGYYVDGTESGLGNEEGISTKLEKGKKYTIQIVQYEGKGDFELFVGKQNKTQHIKLEDPIEGRISFIDQRAVYLYTAEKDGKYTLKFSSEDKDIKVKIQVWDSLDYLVEEPMFSCKSGKKVTFDLKKGETYRFYINQHQGLGDFSIELNSN